MTNRRETETTGRQAAKRLVLALFAAIVLAGCVTGPNAENGQTAPDTMILLGEVTDEGVECPALRATDGNLYTLTGDLRGAGPGDRLRLEVRPVEVSSCMQGQTVEVVQLEFLE